MPPYARPFGVAFTALFGIAVVGCATYVDSVRVRVRDATAVTVSFDSPNGITRLLPPSAATARAELPASEPPYFEAPQVGATVTRDAFGALTLHCPSCDPVHAPLYAPTGDVPLVRSNGEILLSGNLDDVVSRSDGDLHMRFDYHAWQPCYRRRGNCDRPLFAVVLETPRSNVSEIRFVRRVATEYGELFGAKVAVVAGVVLGLVGLGLIGYGAFNNAGGRPLDIAGGLGFGVSSAFFLGWGIAQLNAENSETVVAP